MQTLMQNLFHLLSVVSEARPETTDRFCCVQSCHSTKHCNAGDVDQLPPVGPGKVLSDVIKSGVVPGVDLREIFRQAQQSSIVRTAHAVNNGDYAAVRSSLVTLDAQALQVTQC